jgi:hypothetical protein
VHDVLKSMPITKNDCFPPILSNNHQQPNRCQIPRLVAADEAANQVQLNKPNPTSNPTPIAKFNHHTPGRSKRNSRVAASLEVMKMTQNNPRRLSVVEKNVLKTRRKWMLKKRKTKLVAVKLR